MYGMHVLTDSYVVWSSSTQVAGMIQHFRGTGYSIGFQFQGHGIEILPTGSSLVVAEIAHDYTES